MEVDNGYFRVELVTMAVTETVLNHNVGYLREVSSPLYEKMRMSCSLSQLQQAHIEEVCDDNVDKLIDLGLLNFVPVVVKFPSGISRTLCHSYDEMMRMLDELSGVDLSLLNRTSYNLERKRYGIRNR